MFNNVKQWSVLRVNIVNKDKKSSTVHKMAGTAVNHKLKNLNLEKICRACLEVKRDMRPLFEQLTATMLMGISKVQVRWQINEIFLESIFVSFSLTGKAIHLIHRSRHQQPSPIASSLFRSHWVWLLNNLPFPM